MTQMQEEFLKREEEFRREKLNENFSIINTFIDKLSLLGVELNTSNFNYIPKTGIVVTYKNILSILNPSLHKDKEGLLRVSDLLEYYTIDNFVEGLFYSNDYIVLPHNFFRRGFHEQNHFAPSFISEYWKLNHKEQESYISVDFNRVRIDVNKFGLLERDKWFGSKFNKDISKIGDGIIKFRPPMDLSEFYINFLFNSVYSLEIKWNTKGSIKSFQAKEFKVSDVKVDFEGEKFHPARYIHAEYDLVQNEFRHFDGAIHLYNDEEYYARVNSDFNHNFKDNNKIKSKSFKLFKINGSVDTDLWSLLSSHFLSKNPLFYEYLNEKYPDYLVGYIDRIRERDI